MRVFLAYLLLLYFPSYAGAVNEESQVLKEQLEEVVIIGHRPGPPLWRLENGENTFWVFAMVSPMPRSFEWESSSIEHIIAGSQEYMPAPIRSLGISNPFKAIGILRRLNKIKRIPDNRRLSDILSPNDYNRFQRFKDIYAPNKRKLEKLTPLFAAREIYDGAKKAHGLVETDRISRTIYKMAKRNKLNITKIKVNEKVDSKRLLDEIENLSESQHLTCLTSMLDSLDNEVGAIIQRAVLWAEGDSAALVRESQSESLGNGLCIEQLMQNEQMQRIEQQSRELWLDAAEEALKNNRSSFSVLNLSDVIEPDGLLASMVSRGYELFGPVRD